MPFLIAILTFILVMFLFLPQKHLKQKKMLRNLQSLPGQSGKGASSSLFKRISAKLIYAMKLVNLSLSKPTRDAYQMKLQLAGLENRWTPDDLLAAKVLSGAGLSLYTALFAWVGGSSELYVVAFLLAPMGFFFPNQWVKQRTLKRKQQLRRELPYFLNTVSIMCDAGLNLIPAIREAADKNQGMLSQEFKQVTRDITVGFSQIEALEKMAARCQVDEIDRFVSALSQSIERGASGITILLRNQAKEVWEARKNSAQQLGEQASMKLFFPLLLFAFPATSIFILGPVFIEVGKFIFNS
jgi:tight adherence protein C